MNTDIILKLATVNEKAIMENLISLYLHELSQYVDDLKINKEGKFQYEGIELYFSKDELYPFFIYYKDEIIGFILLNTGKYAGEGKDYLINEFFILNSYRRRGLGTKVVESLFYQYKGRYYLAQLQDNKPAIEFWKNLYIKLHIQYSQIEEIFGDCKCYSQTFEIK